VHQSACDSQSWMTKREWPRFLQDSALLRHPLMPTVDNCDSQFINH
jgi:hypothetical protein